MRAVVQRVSRAAVSAEGRTVGSIGRGLVVLLGVRAGDTAAEADWLAEKLPRLRIFEGEGGKFDRDLVAAGGALLVISQFTVYGDARKGRRPNFGAAAGAPEAEALYERVVARLREAGHAVETGVFGGRMSVDLVNDGPVTLVVDREAGG